MKKKSNLKSIIWDTTKAWPNYPEYYKNIYKQTYLKNYKKYCNWINEIAKNNQKNINWWLSVPASRDERISSLFHKICIFLTLKHSKNTSHELVIITNSRELKKKILNEINLSNIQIKLKSDFNVFKKIWILFRELILLNVNLIIIKIKSKNKVTAKLNIIDIFEIEEKKNYSFYGNFLKKNFPKKNYTLVPTFLSLSPIKIYKIFQQKRNLFFKEKEIHFLDILIILKNFLLNSFFLKKNFLNYNFNTLIREEVRIDDNFRSILTAYINYYFFKNLKKKNIEINKVISWFENQIVDKGWSLGLNDFYPNVDFIGYQGATLHPQFFNLSLTQTEVEARTVPKKILLIGKKYLKNRKIYYKKHNYQITKSSRFSFVKTNKKKKYYLFLLSGIKHCDEYLLYLCKNFVKKFGKKNVFVKYHPILPSKNFSNIMANEITGEVSAIIPKSNFVITSSYTSGLYESLVYNSYTVMVDCTPLDSLLFKDLKKYSKFIYFCKSTKDLFKIINSSNIAKLNQFKKHNNKIKRLFFSKN